MGTEYPAAPIVGVGGVVVRGEQVLVIRRAHDPRKGEWSVPGGVVELGESLTSALRRELHEETGLDVEIRPVVETFDRVHRDGDGRVRYHFVIVDFLCTAPSGEAIAGTDAEAVAWVRADELHAFGIDPHASAVLRKGLALARRIVES